MKRHIPRHNSIGEKIRTARKEKGITLGELAKGICSLGKMSNIENGHIAVTEEELLKFSEKLELSPSFFLDPNINEKIKELDLQKQKISDLIAIKQWRYVQAELRLFKTKIDEYKIPSREIDFHFLSGIYQFKMQQYEQAETLLNSVLLIEENNSYNLRLKCRAYNVMASISFLQKKVTKCRQLLDNGLTLSKESPTMTKEERDNIYYNRSILSLYIGRSHHALADVNKIKHHIIYPIESEYLKLLISLSEDETNNELSNKLLDMRERFQQTNHFDGIVRGWALTIFSTITTKSQFNGIETFETTFLSDLSIIDERDEFTEVSLALLQLAIYCCLVYSDNQAYLKKLLKKSDQLLNKVENPLLTARNHYLLGKFQKMQETSSALRHYQNALQALPPGDESILKAEILYEMSTILHHKNEAMDALTIYHKHLEEQFLFTHFYDLVLPPFKY